MATHDISLKIVHDITIINKDIEVEVRADGDLLGRIRISRGSIDWTPVHKQRPHRVRWRRFADMMEKVPPAAERRG
jgi:hypothetical protein